MAHDDSAASIAAHEVRSIWAEGHGRQQDDEQKEDTGLAKDLPEDTGIEDSYGGARKVLEGLFD